MSTLSGEPLPETLAWDGGMSGSANAGAPFDVRAGRPAGEAHTRRSLGSSSRPRPSARRSCGWPTATRDSSSLVTLIVAGLAWILSGDPVRALAVVVVATPCPLILAAPIALVSGVPRAARAE